MSYWYLGSPYTNYRHGEEAASQLACEAAGLLLDAGILVFSPIVHFHAIRRVIGHRPHEFWMAADHPFRDPACGIIVLRAPGYLDSKGVQFECDYFRSAGKPVVMMDIGAVPVELLG